MTVIRIARADEAARLIEIEWAAGELYRTVGLDFVAEDPPMSKPEYVEYIDDDRCLVAVADDASIAAYVVIDVVDGAAHVEQLSVHPDHARQRIGAALLDAVDEWAARRGITHLTLTTMRTVPWNAPYYERCGFRELGDDEIGPGLRAVMDHEAENGLALDIRTAMRRDVSP